MSTQPLAPRYAKFVVRTGLKHSTKQYILSYPQFLRRFGVPLGVPARRGKKKVLAQAPCRHVNSSFDDQQQTKNARLPSKTKENNSSSFLQYHQDNQHHLQTMTKQNTATAPLAGTQRSSCLHSVALAPPLAPLLHQCSSQHSSVGPTSSLSLSPLSSVRLSKLPRATLQRQKSFSCRKKCRKDCKRLKENEKKRKLDGMESSKSKSDAHCMHGCHERRAQLEP